MKYKFRFSKRALILMISAVLLFTCCVGFTLAFIVDRTDTIANIFNPGRVSCRVLETDWENGDLVKSDVSVLNTGDTQAFIRAAVVINWQNANGDVYSIAPVEGTDYSITFNTDGSWVQGADGYYYCLAPVNAEDDTPVLISNCTVTGASPAEGYTLSVEILATAVQSTPDTAVKDAWNLTIDNDGKLIVPVQ